MLHLLFISFFALENAAIFDHTFLVADNGEVVHSTVITAPRARGIITIVVAGVIAPNSANISQLCVHLPFQAKSAEMQQNLGVRGF